MKKITRKDSLKTLTSEEMVFVEKTGIEHCTYDDQTKALGEVVKEAEAWGNSQSNRNYGEDFRKVMPIKKCQEFLMSILWTFFNGGTRIEYPLFVVAFCVNGWKILDGWHRKLFFYYLSVTKIPTLQDLLKGKFCVNELDAQIAKTFGGLTIFELPNEVKDAIFNMPVDIRYIRPEKGYSLIDFNLSELYERCNKRNECKRAETSESRNARHKIYRELRVFSHTALCAYRKKEEFFTYANRKYRTVTVASLGKNARAIAKRLGELALIKDVEDGKKAFASKSSIESIPPDIEIFGSLNSDDVDRFYANPAYTVKTYLTDILMVLETLSSPAFYNCYANSARALHAGFRATYHFFRTCLPKLEASDKNFFTQTQMRKFMSTNWKILLSKGNPYRGEAFRETKIASDTAYNIDYNEKDSLIFQNILYAMYYHDIDYTDVLKKGV